MASITLDNLPSMALQLQSCHVVIGDHCPTFGMNRPLCMGAAVTRLTEDPAMAFAQTVKDLPAVGGLVFCKTSILSYNRLGRTLVGRPVGSEQADAVRGSNDVRVGETQIGEGVTRMTGLAAWLVSPGNPPREVCAFRERIAG